MSLASSLPAQILNRILLRLNSDRPPAERQANRTTIRRVNRAWCSAINRFEEVHVDHGLNVAAAAFLRSRAAACASMLKLSLTDPEGATGLIALCVNLVELKVALEGGSGRGREWGAIVRALAGLVWLRRFAVEVNAASRAPAEMTIEQLQSFLPSWPSLTSLCLRGSLTLRTASRRAPASALFHRNPNLQHLTLQLNHADIPGIRALLDHLPPSVSSLSLDAAIADSAPTRALGSTLERIAPQLTHAELFDTYARGRLGLDGVVGRLVNVRRLKIGAGAVDRWQSALAPLTNLEDLEIAQPSAPDQPYIDPADLTTVLEAHLPALTKLVLAEKVLNSWSARSQQALATACSSQLRPIKLIVLTSSGRCIDINCQPPQPEPKPVNGVYKRLVEREEEGGKKKKAKKQTKAKGGGKKRKKGARHPLAELLGSATEQA